jgi:hypothetical protein
MRALVVYESMYGSTHVIADSIADGLRGDYEVSVVPVGKATPELVAAVDLVVVGAPTHLRGLSTAKSRQMAAQAAAKAGSRLRMDPDAGGPGMRDWLEDLGHRDGLAAAFDTRVNGLALLTGRASRPIARLLKRHGYRLVAAPNGFLVNSHGTLLDSEATWARRWGKTIAAASKTYLPVHARGSLGQVSPLDDFQDRGGRDGADRAGAGQPGAADRGEGDHDRRHPRCRRADRPAAQRGPGVVVG